MLKSVVDFDVLLVPVIKLIVLINAILGFFQHRLAIDAVLGSQNRQALDISEMVQESLAFWSQQALCRVVAIDVFHCLIARQNVLFYLLAQIIFWGDYKLLCNVILVLL